MQLKQQRPASDSEVPAGATEAGGRQVRHGLRIGILTGLAAITCCVSPVVLVLLGVATSVQAISLGNTLYYDYGWWFRGFGIALAALAVFIYLRRRRSCSIQGAKGHRWMLVTLVASGGATYLGLFWFTKMLGVWFG